MPELINTITLFLDKYGAELLKATIDTLLVTSLATGIAYLIGIPLAVIVLLTAPGSLKPQPVIHTVLGWVINIGRSMPFIILMVALIPLTRLLVGTTIGLPGAIVPLAIGATPFVARMVESSFSEIHPGKVEAAQAFGANTIQIITKVLLRESLPSLARGAAIAYITLIGYSAILGSIGNGGLGDLAIRYGYHRYVDEVMWATIILLIIIVQVVQSVCDIVARKIDKR